MSLREKIKAAKDFKIKIVNVPEWDVDVFVRTLHTGETIEYADKAKQWDSSKIMGLYLSYSLCEEDGTRIYQATEEDVNELYSKDTDVVIRLYNESQDFNGEGLKGEEDREKKS